MPRNRARDRGQFVLELELERRPPELLVTNPSGLVETLADLLLEALSLTSCETAGGDDEGHA